jgi:lysyl endopeptidase
MIKRSLFHATLFFLLLISIRVIGQSSGYAKPISASFPALLANCELKELKPPDINQLLQEDTLSASDNAPYRMGVSLPVEINCNKNGKWQDITGGKLWLMKIRSSEAAALGLYFSRFLLPDGCVVNVFDSARTQVLGPFTKNSNPVGGLFAAGITPGQVLFIECYCPDRSPMPYIVIDEVLYVYRSGGIPHVNSTRDFGGADSCEVNINCEEGQAWQDEKHGVVRILIKIGGSTFWCTGSLINNTSNDFTPYIITADHCAKDYWGKYASPTDLQQWIFYFNFESADCSNPLVQPILYSSVGANKLAGASSDSGSDFYLAVLNHKIPGSYMPFFNGWDRSGRAAQSGVTIHQPEGDIKKISTYNTTLVSSEWGSTPGTHWLVRWIPTVNGNGVTEHGSSGSPLFDETGHILGCLTGGNSSCDDLLSPDYYGKFDYSWESNGSADSLQLRPWLDPDNTGATVLPGSYNTNLVVADFSVDTINIPRGSSLNFRDQSLGNPTSWNWSFEGAEPSTSDKSRPEGIKYPELGTFDVKLIVSNDVYSDTITRKNYIKVTPVIYPNPSQGIVYFHSWNDNSAGTLVLVYNLMGKLVYKTQWPINAGNVYKLDLSFLAGNIFFISYSAPQGTVTDKVILLPKQ